MTRKHRPFENLTWEHMGVIRAAANGHDLHFRGDSNRAIRGLLGMSVPPISFKFGKVSLTDSGQAIWERMKEWRPDLYKENAA